MQYNSHATEQDLVSLANTLSQQNNTSFPLTKKTSFANMGNRLIMTTIHEAYGGWKYDDKNNSDFPIATTHLVSGRDDYALPVDTTHLNAVYVKDESGVWNKLIPITLEQINDMEAEPEFNKTDSKPIYYRPLANSFKIYPAADYAQDDSVMVEYSRDISTFATTDTTKTPGFDPQFHEALAVYMAFQFKVSASQDSSDLAQQWVDYLLRIKKHYSQKYQELFPPRIRMNYNFNQYL